MTGQTTEQVAQPVQVAAPQGSRLEQLHQAYADAKAAADEAAARYKAVTDAIKAELNQAAPDAPRIDLVGPAGPALRLSYSETWRLDSRRLKADDPELYVRYAKKSGSWTLKAAGGGSE